MEKQNISLSNKSYTASPVIQSFTLLLIFVWTRHTILPFVAQVFRRLPFIGQIYDWIITLLIIIAIAIALPQLSNSLRGNDILFYIGASLMVAMSIVVYPKNASYISASWWEILGMAVPMYFVGLCYNHNQFKNILYWGSIIGVCTMYAYQLYQLALGRTLHSDNMSAAYNTLPSIMYLIYWAFKKKGIWHWLLAAFAFSLTLVFGTRGAMLAAIVFFFANILFFTFRSRSPFVSFIVLLVSLIAIIIFSSSELLIDIIQRFADLFRNIGFSTRIFDAIINGELAESIGRSQIYDTVILSIRENPIFGYGLMGDRVVSQALSSATYAHNLFLEIWCQFGVVTGTAILIIIISIPLRAMARTRGTDSFHFILMLTCLVFTKLFFTGSYLNEAYLFFLLGVCIHILRTPMKGHLPYENCPNQYAP